MANLKISEFTFQFSGHGHYSVTYTSPGGHRKYTATVSDMTLIDRTKNSDKPKGHDLQELYNTIKRNNY